MPIQNAWGRSKSEIHSSDAYSPLTGTIDVHIPKQTAFATAILRCYATASPGPPSGAAGPGQPAPRSFVASCGIVGYTEQGNRHSLRSESPWGSDAYVGDKKVECITFAYTLESSSPSDGKTSYSEADFAFQYLGWGE